jgi:RNA polymerase sigma-70 factor (ECF subfamily)
MAAGLGACQGETFEVRVSEAHARTPSGHQLPVSAVVVQMSLNAVRKSEPRPGPAVVTPPRTAAELASTDRLEERIFALVYRQMNALWGRWRGDFDDVVQAAAEQAVRSLPAFRKESELSTWTYKICYRVAMRQRRWSTRWLRRFSLDSPHADATDASMDACSRMEHDERVARMRGALDRLSQKLRAVVVMRDLEGLEITEIAEIAGVGEATVRSRLRDGRRRLAELLKADPYFGVDACGEARR